LEDERAKVHKYLALDAKEGRKQQKLEINSKKTVKNFAG
jgi:hypothetical protein